ncbi:hypothetical protein [Sphingobacterium detergens]|uniref:hypothetical protein n=1 Tax=Sphingobacterium detergens TaxID=1145106 RepID=UPI003AAF6A98
MKHLIQTIFKFITDHFTMLAVLNIIFNLSKHLFTFIEFINKRNRLRPIARLFSKLSAKIVYAFHRTSKVLAQFRLFNLSLPCLSNNTKIDKITGAVMLTGIILLIPISFIGAFLTGLLHFTEKQNLLKAISVAMLYFGFISTFAYMQYRILRSTAVA